MQQSVSGIGDAVTIRPWWLRYAMALTGVAVAIALRAAMTPFWGETSYPFVFFYPVIAFSALMLPPNLLFTLYHARRLKKTTSLAPSHGGVHRL